VLHDGNGINHDVCDFRVIVDDLIFQWSSKLEPAPRDEKMDDTRTASLEGESEQ
jgi:hypothetical protein